MTATVTDLNARTIIQSAIVQQIIRERDEAQNAAMRYREGLTHLRGDHEPDAELWCKRCGISWPCPEREFLDELLHPGGKR